MKAHELIASGLLEAYVLGEGSGEERALVERLAASDPSVKAELEAIELALEQHAFHTAIAPPDHVRDRLMAAINAETPKVLPIGGRKDKGRSMPWLAAAAVVALLLSAAGNLLLYGKLREVNDRLAELEEERTILAEQMQVQQASMKRAEDQLAVVFDPRMHVVPLAGQVIEPSAAARIFMDPATNEVFFDVLSLPKPPPGKQYQLWAQVDGRMVDAGMLDVADHGDQLQRMKPMANATAFGVTLENAGGSVEPTLTALYLFGQAG